MKGLRRLLNGEKKKKGKKETIFCVSLLPEFDP